MRLHHSPIDRFTCPFPSCHTHAIRQGARLACTVLLACAASTELLDVSCSRRRLSCFIPAVAPSYDADINLITRRDLRCRWHHLYARGVCMDNGNTLHDCKVLHRQDPPCNHGSLILCLTCPRRAHSVCILMPPEFCSRHRSMRHVMQPIVAARRVHQIAKH